MGGNARFKKRTRALGLRTHRGNLAWIFALKSKSLNRCSVVVPLEVPRTEMVSLQLLVDLHRNTGIQKQLRKPGQAPRETIGKELTKMAWIWGFWVAWIWRGLFGTGKKRAQKIHVKSTPISGTKSAPFFAEIRAQIRAAKSKNPRRAPALVPSVLARSGVLSSRTERPLANAVGLWRKGRMN